MFGMEQDKEKEKKAEPTVFEMETSLKKNPQKKKELVNKMQSRLDYIKGFLREGADKKKFEKMGFILLGYASCIKVINRIN